jgi:hypothetical protein
VSDLLIDVLSALLATNQPATVCNLVYKKTGMAVPVINQNDPVERAYKKLMLDDDVAQEEVDQKRKRVKTENEKETGSKTKTRDEKLLRFFRTMPGRVARRRASKLS